MELKRISPQEAQDLQGQGYTYLDVRSIPEFEAGHPQEAINLPLLHADPAQGMVPNPEFMEVLAKTYPKESKLVIGCQSGGRSAQAAQFLMANGWTDVVDQRAGFGGARNPETGAVVEAGWAESGLPVESGNPPDQSYENLRNKAGLA